MNELDKLRYELNRVESAIRAQNALRGILPDEEVDTILKGLSEKRQAYIAQLSGSGAIAEGDGNIALGERSAMVDGSVNNSNINTGTQITIIGQPNSRHTLSGDEAKRLYLNNLISLYQHLRLQGIRAGSQPLSVSLEKVYISLTAVDKNIGKRWIEKNEAPRDNDVLSITEALKVYRRLVIIGDPGCGKTTLLSYLALTYSRANLNENDLVQQRLGIDENDCLPILLALRNLGGYIRKLPDVGKDGPTLLLDYLNEYFKNQNIPLPESFFETQLENGKAIILLDGMDELPDVKERQRIARLIEKFVVRYSDCRYVITSREVGYEGASRLGTDFGLAKVRDFSPSEVRQFVHDWTYVIETTLAKEESPEIVRIAEEQSKRLIDSIERNRRVSELAVNPLLLTVIALVHRYRAQLPERRSELYEEAVEVLLGHWDDAKGGILNESNDIGMIMDGGDRRSLLEPIAFYLQENKQREIETNELHALLLPAFNDITGSHQKAIKATGVFLRLIGERSGLLIERGLGSYGFAHLTFQEYLAARALADRKDLINYTEKILSDPWWREVVLLLAGYLSTQGKKRVSEFIKSILSSPSQQELEPHHNLLLAAEALFDVGPARVEGDLLAETRKRLEIQANAPIQIGNRQSLLDKILAMNALSRIETRQFTSQFWSLPWGEPEWVAIPSSDFKMGGDGDQDGSPVHTINMPKLLIARVPITNAQYSIYIADTGALHPEHWRSNTPPKKIENHPVTNVSWFDAKSYCDWLSRKTNKKIRLLSEAEWEMGARGIDGRIYPWGNDWMDFFCNTKELGLGNTTPVGLFLSGSSPYGLLDMIGNIWEWTRTIWHEDFKYPYTADDGRENVIVNSSRVLRGSSFYDRKHTARCAYRDWDTPDHKSSRCGFRVSVQL